MIQQDISRGAENASNPRFRKKAMPLGAKGLKQRSKALGDVKNTIHAHASNLFEKGKNGEKKPKKDINGSGKTRKKLLNTLEKENDIHFDIDVLKPDFDCINHHLCEEANNMIRKDLFDKLTLEEMKCFTDRMNFFRMDPLPLTTDITPDVLKPLDDIELHFIMNPPRFHDQDLIDFSIEVPEPPDF